MIIYPSRLVQKGRTQLIAVTEEGPDHRDSAFELCLYCGKEVGEDATVVWHHSCDLDNNLYLHPPCAVEFTMALLRDVKQVEANHHLKISLIHDPDKVPFR